METEIMALNTTGKTLIVVTDNNYTAIINPDGFVDINVADLKDSRQIKHMLEKGWLRIEEIKEEPEKHEFTNEFQEEIENMYLGEEEKSEPEKDEKGLSNEDAWEKVKEMIKTEVDNIFVRHNMNQNDQIELLQNQVDALVNIVSNSVNFNDKPAIANPTPIYEKPGPMKDIVDTISKALDELKELC